MKYWNVIRQSPAGGFETVSTHLTFEDAREAQRIGQRDLQVSHFVEEKEV